MTLPTITEPPAAPPTRSAWPTVADVAAQLGITGTPPESVTVSLQAAVDGVQFDVGWSTDQPPSGLWQAALLAAVAAVKAPDAPFGIAAVFDVGALYVARQHPTYVGLLRGYRRSFGIG